MQRLPNSPASTPTEATWAAGSLSYYPARHRGTYPDTRAALAALGCVGTLADLYQANARAEGSHAVAVPVTAPTAPADCGECLALVIRKPGGRADLYVGLVGLADPDADRAGAIAQELAQAVPGRWVVMTWARQPKVTQ